MSMNYEKAKPSNILLVAITRMGDMLQATPMIAGLKQQYPDAKLTVLIEKQFQSICEGIKGIDSVLPIDLALVCQCLARERDGIVDAYKYLEEMIEDLRAREFDFCINMASSAYTALLLKILNIKDNRGWVSDEEGFRIISNPWTMLFAAFIYHSNRDYNSINLVDIFRCSADVYKHPHSLVYDVPERAQGFAEKFLESEGLAGEGPIIAIQAGASQEKRQWLPQRFAFLARELIEKLNARLIFTGSKSELKIIDAIFTHYRHPQMVCAAGKTDLGELAALLKKADVLITGDTGPMHLAVAVGTPVVSLFLASALCFETGPYGPGNVVLQPQVGCNPCNPNLPCSRPDCHDQVSPLLVFHMTKLRLEKSDEELVRVSIPKEIANPKDVAVFVTTFDEDNFLEFRNVNGFAPRKDFPAMYFQAARETYRYLWKSEFGFKAAGTEIEDRLTTMPSAIQGIPELMELSKLGRDLLSELNNLILDPHSPPRRLGEVNAQLSEIDRQIENIGLRNSLLGALIRMFIMEKENMRGDDPLQLSRKMGDLYGTLEYRSEKFGKLFNYYLQQN